MNEYDFHERLAFSRGLRGVNHQETIMRLIPGCVGVQECNGQLNKLGIDFIATLRRGARLNIDMKSRDAGCSAHWYIHDGIPVPEIALEVWSIKPNNGSKGAVGWTLDESKVTDYTMHIFDPKDSMEVFLFPFQLLRMAFRARFKEWMKKFRVEDQSSGRWESQCVFIPSPLLIATISEQMKHRQKKT